jgi:hypothetical protein
LTDALNKGSSSSSSSKTTENSSGNTRSGSTDFPLGRLIQEASKRRLALTRIGVRFGGSLTSVQAERLRERASGANDLGERLAVRGADALDVLADAISSLDSDLAKIKAKLTAGFDFI